MEKDGDKTQCSGSQIGDWVKGKMVGSGSFGTVHLAMNKATGALFVVKSAYSEAGVQALRDEAEILESLNSPYVVGCMGRDFLTGRNGEETLHVFMEYMAGGTLSNVAENFGVLDAEVIRLYTREILHGLKYLHENGNVHCDLKCKNVLLGLNGNVKLADFGCARRINDSKKGRNFWQSIGGTPLWMAPEVLRNEGLDFASDIWSLGCIVIEMATGKYPWGDNISNPVAAVLKIACSNEKPQFPSHFSKEGLDFLAKCLERNPKRRWSAGELLNHPFITGNEMRNSTEKYASSPSSILDFGLRNDKYNSAESDTSDEELQYRNPFSTRCCGNRNRAVRRPETQTDFWSSEGWITVRSS
ncbi:Pkinase domain-containing protein [Melia azedarach]|uniref:Pkinase domain-containing protein n=1 Tax=Melia azedarach TaxID=155640 RepID=A0ACC1Y1I2_MELAZ|nr:Pkinase domain-containing protein [Melia azedarach]